MLNPISLNHRLVALWIAIASILLAHTGVALAFEEVNKTFSGVAIKGYDTVAYHTEDRAVKGKSEFSHEWSDAKWYFSSAGNRDLFAADPERYAPQYGGYCAGNLSMAGEVAGVNPKNFKIIDRKLYLSWSRESADDFEANAKENIRSADQSWERLTSR